MSGPFLLEPTACVVCSEQALISLAGYISIQQVKVETDTKKK